MDFKTNAMRILDRAGVEYARHSYEGSGAVSGTEVAAVLRLDPARVFKTLVTVSKTGKPYVFMLPVCRELDLKKAAQAVGEKSVEMLKSKELLPLTGYVHGGCSPVGMKKVFTTVADSSARDFPSIVFSAGRIGHQVELGADSLSKVLRVSFSDICV